MKSAILPNTAPQKQQRFTSKAEMHAHFGDVFTATVSEYARIRQLSPVVAHQIDPDPSVRTEKLTFGLIDYALDIEHATETALKDSPALQAVWFAIALGKPTDAQLAQQVTTRCGRVYAARGLAPWSYFRRNRHAHRKVAA